MRRAQRELPRAHRLRVGGLETREWQARCGSAMSGAPFVARLRHKWLGTPNGFGTNAGHVAGTAHAVGRAADPLVDSRKNEKPKGTMANRTIRTEPPSRGAGSTALQRLPPGSDDTHRRVAVVTRGAFNSCRRAAWRVSSRLAPRLLVGAAPVVAPAGCAAPGTAPVASGRQTLARLAWGGVTRFSVSVSLRAHGSVAAPSHVKSTSGLRNASSGGDFK